MSEGNVKRSFERSGNIIDLVGKEIFPGRVMVHNGIIQTIERLPGQQFDTWLMPGFVDAHIHIESTLMVPSEFALAAVRHGTVATVSDPHEIANVLGIEGVDYMIENGRSVPFKFYFSAPSCVPATPFETNGARLDTEAVEQLLDRDEIKYLGEVMNVPDVLAGDEETLAKIAAARSRDKRVDGHAPGVTGEDARRYAEAGIETDHESMRLDEAEDKLDAGMKIAIREGSAARNFDKLVPLLTNYGDRCMFCTDDCHPDVLQEGHINKLAARAVSRGYDLITVLRAACLNPVEHYNLEVGLLQEGDPADFIEVGSLETFEVKNTWINGRHVFKEGNLLLPSHQIETINNFSAQSVHPVDFQVEARSKNIRLITAEGDQLVTGGEIAEAKIRGGLALADPEQDLLKLAVVNRYHPAQPAVAFIRGFGLKEGALASSVAHDSHNIIAVGADDESLSAVMNRVIEQKGGLCAGTLNEQKFLSLPIAGLMSDLTWQEVTKTYSNLREQAQQLGCTLPAPFLTLSFMALLVIPKLKLSDKGLFDGEDFTFVDLFA